VPFTPHAAGVHAIGRAQRLLDASRRTTPGSIRGDMRRLAVVMAVAALDTYMHRLIVHRAYTHETLPPALARLDIPFERLLLQADDTGAAARADPHNSRPRVGIKRQKRDRLFRETFQRFDDVSRALAMSGLTRSWDEIGARLDPALRPPQIRRRLDSIVVRRNQIVHEGDYARLERPRGPGRNGITYAEAGADIAFIADLIDAIDEVV
jgi:hypothetical protein